MTAPGFTSPQLGQDPNSKRSRLNIRLAEMKNERSSFLGHWRELSDFIQPTRARFTVADTSRGQRRSKNIIDSTGTMAARTQASGMMSGMSNPSRPWIKLTTPDPELADLGPVKEWLFLVTQRMHTVFSRSNLYKVLPLMYADIGTFGTSAVGVFENTESVLRCTHFPIGSYMIANDEDGRVNGFIREFQMTVGQIVSKFGGDPAKPDLTGISNTVRRAWEGRQYQKWINVIHAIFPNDDYDGVSKLSKRKKFLQCYYEVSTDGDKVLEESGFDEFPILAPRWEVTGEDVYGTNCPGMTALGDVKQLQHGERRSAQAIDKTINPPMKAPWSMRTGKNSILPGDISYSTDPEKFTPAMEINRDIVTPIENKQAQVRRRIQRAYYEDLFLMLDSMANTNPQMTATEIAERKEEKLLALGPVLEQVNDDAFDPLVDRTFAIMQRAGHIPPPPPELEGAVLKVEYISIMAQAQKQVGLSALERFSGFLAQLVQFKPDALDKADTDELLTQYGDMAGVPPKIINPDDAVKAIRDARAKANEAAQAAAHAEVMSKSAKNLAQSPTGGAQNALTDLMQSGGGSPQQPPMSSALMQ